MTKPERLNREVPIGISSREEIRKHPATIGWFDISFFVNLYPSPTLSSFFFFFFFLLPFLILEKALWKALQEALYFYEIVQMREFDVDPGVMMHHTCSYLDGGYYKVPEKEERFRYSWNPYMSICADKNILDFCIVRKPCLNKLLLSNSNCTLHTTRRLARLQTNAILVRFAFCFICVVSHC